MIPKLFVLLLLFAINFSLQNVNFLTLSWNNCDYYIYTPSCASEISYLLNKSIRLLINLFSIYKTLQFIDFIPNKTNTLYFIIAFTIGFIIDMLLSFSSISLLINFHKVLNPLLYSPLIALVLITYYFSKS